MKQTRSPLRIAILAVGSELLDGRVLDTNSQFVARELEGYGCTLVNVLICDDVIEDIQAGLKFLSMHANLIIISGGLGPTTDDLTREAVAEFTNDQLESRESALSYLRQIYAAKKRELDPSNFKQATFPSRAKGLANEFGTAPGFWTTHNVAANDCQLVALPGVPREFKQMFSAHLLPFLDAQNLQRLERHVFRIFGLPEAGVNTRLQSVQIPPTVVVSYRAAFPEIHLILKNVGEERQFAALVKEVRAAIEPQFIISEAKQAEVAESLVQRVHCLLTEAPASVATAESCTSGLLAKLLTDLPGSSQFYTGGVNCYSNDVKLNVLGVSTDALSQHGAVSAEVALQLATGVRHRTASDFGISITGIAGPDGGTTDKPVGTFFIGMASSEAAHAYQFFFNSSRDWIRLYAAYSALDLLRRTILRLPLPNSVGS